MSWRVRIAVAAALTLPGLALRLPLHPPAALSLVLDGGAVVAASFLLAWAAEAAEVDISGGLAVALLALIAILPEFVVGIYFAYVGGHRPGYAQFATANVTGSLRLLIGFGVGTTTLIYLIARRRRERAAAPGSASRPFLETRPLQVAEPQRVELGFLAVGAAYAVVITLTRQIAVWDTVILLAIYAAYLWRTARGPHEQPDLVGVAASIGGLPATRRRAVVTALFAWAAFVVFLVAAPFAESIVEVGGNLHINQFILVQWIAPLASEAPELVIAPMLALRGKPSKGIAALLSSTINQWTLALGALAVAYLAGGGHGPLPLTSRQADEFILTIAQALLGVAVLIDLRVGVWEALGLLGLFAAQFAVPSATGRVGLAIVYAVVALVMLVIGRSGLLPLGRALRRGPESA